MRGADLRRMAQLERLVRARNRQLEHLNLELLRARDAARAGSRVKREFLANIGHEIRTPMNAILGMTQLALLGELAPTQRQYLETARGAAQSLMATINDILDLSVLESGRLGLELAEFRLEEVLARLAAVLDEKAQLKRIELQIDAAPEALVPLVGDPYRLGQVLINLCDNALKFSEQGEVRVRVRVEQGAGERLGLRFSVSDSGMGISAQQLERLFQPFSQLDASNTRRNGGAGMGLAIARELVELMGGELKVASEPGRGSEFSFSAFFQAPGSAARASAGLQGSEPPCREFPGISLPAGVEQCRHSGQPSPTAARPEPASAPTAPRELDRELVRELLGRMAALFYSDLSQALALKELLHRELEGSVAAPEFRRLARQMEQFDFDGALKSRNRIEGMLDDISGERGLHPPLAR